MKKYVVILGLVFTVLVFASCKLEKGGTIEVKNGDSDYYASIRIVNADDNYPVAGGEEKRAAPGETVTFIIGEDGTYIAEATFSLDPTQGSFVGHGRSKKITLSGGNKETVSVEPSN